jgi:two-component system sensor histidine kinase RegB
VPLSHLIEEVVAPYRGFAAEIVVAPASGVGPEPVGRRNPAVIQGLANLVENAVDFARTNVTIATAWNADDVAVTIADDGPGFAAGIMERIGEPYVTTRGPRSTPADPEAGGLGLGFFIAKTLLERSGARLTLGNREPPTRGAIVKVVWPRRLMDSEAQSIGEVEDNSGDGITWLKPVKSL